MRTWLVSATVLPLALAAIGAKAQVPEPPVGQVPKLQTDAEINEEIIVTAQRREESLQDVPVTVTSQSAQSLEDAAVRNLEELKTLVSGYQGPGDNAAQSPHIRGVGSTAIQPGAESVVALYVDDIYIGAPSPALITLNNVVRVDVLKGPQGTLFGRNTTAGVVQVTTRSPSETTWSGEVTAGYGNYDVFNGTLYAGGPISKAISSDLAVQVRTQGEGWGTNLFTGRDVYKTNLDLGIRSKSIIRLAPETELEFSADYELNKTRGMNVLTPIEGSRSILGYVSQARGWDADSNLTETGRTEAWGANGKVRHDFGFAEFVSITALRRTTYTTTDSDVDGTPAALLGNFRDAKNKQFTQELQLFSPAGGPFAWTAGLFYYRADDDALYLTTLSPLIFRGLTRQTNTASIDTESVAAYGQGTVHLSDRTNLTLGGRYTDENAKLNAQVDTFAGATALPGTPIKAKTSDNSSTWRISLDHHFSSDVMAYASYNRGQKSGGFNIANPATPPYLPEKLNAYEVGFRSEFADRRLTLNASAFYYDYSDVQVLGFVGTAIQLFNGAGAELYGVDVDFRAKLSDRFTISGGFEYLHSEFTSFPNATISTPRPTGGFAQFSGSATGNELPQAPDFTASITGTYRLPIDVGDWRLSATYYYNDGFFFEADNRLRQPDFGLLSASLTYSKGAVSLRLWGNNLTNEQVMNTLITSQLNSVRKFNAPRAYGVTLGYRY